MFQPCTYIYLMMISKVLLIVFLAFLQNASFVVATSHFLRFGILKVQEISSNKHNKFCYAYYPGLTKTVIYEEDLKFYNASDIYSMDLCEESPPTSDVQGTVAFASKNSNCSVIDQASEIEEVGGLGSIFVGSGWRSQINTSNITLNTGFLSNKSYQSILDMGKVLVGSYSSVSNHENFMYYTLVIIWLMAQFSIVVGSFWSGVVRHHLYLSEQEKLKETVSPCHTDPQNVQQPRPLEESSLNLSPKIVVLMVSMMCVFLVGLWALLDYLVYFIIALFCLASFYAVYSCFEPFVLKIPCGTCRTPYFNLYLAKGVLELRQIILLLLSISVVIVWLIFRKEPYAWILQDFLGITFCINMMVRVRLPNLMICTLLLCLLVIYDIFFVFITPFITSSGTSIMVDVAKGGNSSEELPMVLKVPYFVYPEVYDVCNIRNYSLLGFGDILVPGLLISFVHSFDLRVGTPCRLYFTVNVISYGCGLLLTFLCLLLMNMAQPALFYLVPAILVPTVIIAAARGELSNMWSDRIVKSKSSGDLSTDDRGQLDESTNAGRSGSPFFSNSHNHSHSEALLDSTDDQARYNSMDSDNKSSCTNSSTEALNRKISIDN